MTAGAATVAVVLALMGGIYWARWRRAEWDRRRAQEGVTITGKAAWRARRVILVVAFFLVAALDVWVRRKGH